MYTGIYQFAGFTFELSSVYPDVHTLCRDYQAEGPMDFSVSTVPEDIALERRKSEREDALEGIPVRRFPEGYLETLAIYRKIANLVLFRDTLLFHGSAIAVDGAAYLFTAKSGTGKSTHTRLWRDMLGPRAVMVNDDKPLLKISEKEVLVCGTPWDGKHHLSCNIAVPLKSICILERGEVPDIQPISPGQALPMLLQQSYRPASPEACARVLSLIDRMTGKLSFYRLKCNISAQAARLSYQALHGKDHMQ